MKFPPYLSQNALVALVSPAGRVNADIVKQAVQILTNRGFKVIVGDHALSHHYQLAGTDQERLSDLQYVMDHPNIEAIFCIRGGYGTIRIIDQLDFSYFVSKPKWIVGFSDITVLHSCLQNSHQIASIHSLMPKNFTNHEDASPDFEMLMQNLTGKFPSITVDTHPFNRLGNCKGQMTGGNLSIIQSLRGTKMDIEPDGKILFIEDIGEYMYRIDRMIYNLKLSGILERISGLIVGQFTELQDNKNPFGLSAYEIIRDAVQDYNYPVMFNFPAGHSSPNYPLVLGKNTTLNVEINQAELNMTE